MTDIPIESAAPTPSLANAPIEAAEPSSPETPSSPRGEKSDSSKQEGPPPIFDLPDEVQKVPVVQWISIGKPPAVRVGPEEHYKNLEPVEDNLDKVLEGGMDVFVSSTGDSVLYNPLLIGLEELKQIDAAGQLQQYIPDYASLTGEKPEVLSDAEKKKKATKQEDMVRKLRALGSEGEEQPAQSVLPKTGAAPQAPAAPAAAQQEIASARGKQANAQLGSPTSGPKPGGGRLLNSLLQRPV